jgi:uncharacterized alkaline shock family protein YloU
MEGHATVSAGILGRYAADAAGDVPGVRGLTGRRAARVTEAGGRVTVELHVGMEWGASIPDVGRALQERVGAYLERMTDLDLAGVNVVVDEVS